MLQISVVWNHSRQEAEEVNTETIMTIALFLVLLGAAILVMVQNNRAGKRYLLNRIKKDWFPTVSTVMRSWTVSQNMGNGYREIVFILMILPGMIWIWKESLC